MYHAADIGRLRREQNLQRTLVRFQRERLARDVARLGSHRLHILALRQRGNRDIVRARRHAIQPERAVRAAFHALGVAADAGGTNTADSAGGSAWTGTLPNGGNLAGGALSLSKRLVGRPGPGDERRPYINSMQ